MPKYILKRILILIPTIIGVSFVVFSLLYLSPGDAALASAGPNAPKETVEILRDKMGLNDPFLIQYGRFLKNLIFHFDLGTSYQSKTPVIEKILRVFPNTLKLAGVSLIFAVISGIILGIIAGINKNNIIDSLISFAGMIGLAMPIFWSGLLLIIIFSSKLKLLPASGFSSWRSMAVYRAERIRS